MEFRLFADLFRDVSVKNKILLISNIVSDILLVIVTLNCVYLSHQVRTIVVPSHLASAVEIKGEKVSADYIRIMCLHLTELLYTYTPYSIAENYQEFLAYVPADRLNGVKAQLQSRIDQTAKLKISESFLPREVLFPEDGICLVSGKVIRWSVGEQLATDDLYIRYNYRIYNGGLSVEEITLLTGSDFIAHKRTRK